MEWIAPLFKQIEVVLTVKSESRDVVTSRLLWPFCILDVLVVLVSSWRDSKLAVLILRVARIWPLLPLFYKQSHSKLF